MIKSKVSKRYASALFLEALNRNSLEEVSADMQGIHDTIFGSEELRRFLKSHTVTRMKKKEAVMSLFSESTGSLTRRFLELILEKKRENELAAIAEAFQQQYKKEKDIVDVEVFVVKKTDSGQNDLLRKALARKTKKNVNLIFIEDASLKGGIAVKIDDTVIDGSIKHKLQQLEVSFRQSGV